MEQPPFLMNLAAYLPWPSSWVHNLLGPKSLGELAGPLLLGFHSIIVPEGRQNRSRLHPVKMQSSSYGGNKSIALETNLLGRPYLKGRDLKIPIFNINLVNTATPLE